MRNKLSATLMALLIGSFTAFTTSGKMTFLNPCSTIPTTAGPNIDAECPYSSSTTCCYLAAGSSTQYVRQTQNGTSVIIRRSASSMVTIFGIKSQLLANE